jgi:putative FmdB family regulatory protein
MPLYEYECDACHQRFEVIQKYSDLAPEVCPQCGKGPVQRQLSSPAIQFKGSGWYITDYAGGRSNSASSTSGSDGDAKSESSGESKGESKKDGEKKSAGESSSTKRDSASSSSTTPSKPAASSSTKDKPSSSATKD